MKKFATKTLVTLIVLAVIAASAYESVAVVAPNERGVQVMLGEVTGDVLEPGMHFHPPFVSIIKK